MPSCRCPRVLHLTICLVKEALRLIEVLDTLQPLWYCRYWNPGICHPADCFRSAVHLTVFTSGFHQGVLLSCTFCLRQWRLWYLHVSVSRLPVSYFSWRCQYFTTKTARLVLCFFCFFAYFLVFSLFEFFWLLSFAAEIKAVFNLATNLICRIILEKCAGWEENSGKLLLKFLI